MFIYYLQLTNSIYDLNSPLDRHALRYDLQMLGFFRVDGMDLYYRWFDEYQIGIPRIIELMARVKLFTVYKLARRIPIKN